MLLEGPNKFKQVIFNNSVFEKSIEHYIYQNQLVSVKCENQNDQVVVSQLVYKPNYREIKGEKEERDKKPSRTKKPKSKAIPQKDRDNKESKDKTETKRKKPAGKRSPPKKAKKTEPDLSSVLKGLDELPASKSTEKIIQKPKKDVPEYVSETESKLNKIETSLSGNSEEKEEIKGDTEIDELERLIMATEPVKETETVLQDTKNEITSIEPISKDEVQKTGNFVDKDTEELVSMITKPESSGEEKEKDLSDLAFMMTKAEETSEDNLVSSEDNLDDLVSALAASGDIDSDELKQFQSMQDQLAGSPVEEEEEKDDEEDDLPYQKGFLDPSSKAFKKRVSNEEQLEETEKPRKTLREELAEETPEETLLEKLVIEAEDEIDEEDDFEYIYEDPTEIPVEQDEADDDRGTNEDEEELE
jgi:hypothetical protein